jgi:hypothetical protein
VSQAYLARGGVGAAAHQGHGTTTRLCGGNTSFFHEENKEAFSPIFFLFSQFVPNKHEINCLFGAFYYLCAKL